MISLKPTLFLSIRMMIHDLTLIRADNPNNCKRGGVGIYFKEYLTVRPESPLNLNECLVLEINIQNKKEYVISLY